MSTTNQMARRVCTANAVVSLIPSEHNICGTNDDVWLARMTERLGDIGHAYRTGTTDITDETLKLAATVMGFLDYLGEQAAQ